MLFNSKASKILHRALHIFLTVAVISVRRAHFWIMTQTECHMQMRREEVGGNRNYRGKRLTWDAENKFYILMGQYYYTAYNKNGVRIVKNAQG